MNDNAIVPAEQAQHLQSAEKLAKSLRPLFPDDIKSSEQAMAVANVAISYGLDPLMQELVPYQGKPYITIKGLVRVAERFPAYDGVEDEPASQAEREALGCDEGEIIWKAYVYRTDRNRPTKAYGRAGGPGERNNLVSGDNRAKKVFIKPGDMARKRAIHAALRMAFPTQLPGEMVDPVTKQQLRALHAIDTNAGVDRDRRHQEIREIYGVDASSDLTKDQASGYIDGRLVDLESGEIVEPDVIDVDTVKAETPADAGFDPEPEPEAEPEQAVSDADTKISIQAISQLDKLIKDVKLTPDMLQEEMQAMFGKTSLSALTTGEGRKLYTAVKKMRDGE